MDKRLEVFKLLSKKINFSDKSKNLILETLFLYSKGKSKEDILSQFKGISKDIIEESLDTYLSLYNKDNNLEKK